MKQILRRTWMQKYSPYIQHGDNNNMFGLKIPKQNQVMSTSLAIHSVPYWYSLSVTKTHGVGSLKFHSLIFVRYISDETYLLQPSKHSDSYLTHWGRATHICVSKLTIIASDNGLLPGRRQAIIWNNAGILSIGLLGTNFFEILI